MTTFQVIGHPADRVDGPQKVTGEALYTADIQLLGTLWGKILRSPYPHARIVSIDTADARAMPGVHTVLTGADVQGVLYGRRLRDVPALAQDRVRFIGEPVAAVAAETEDIAAKALELIDVEYEELGAVFNPFEAMKEDAPILHPDLDSYPGLPAPLGRPTNAFVRNTWNKGDPEIGFAEADTIIEREYSTPMVHQAYLEPYSCLVWIDDDNRVQVWASNKAPFALRGQLSDALEIPIEDILLNQTYIGGDFGGKGSPLNVPICYFLAKHSGRPVRIVMNYLEEFMAANPRHASTITMKTGVKSDGTLTAHEVSVVFNSGAYGGFKPGVNLGGASRAAGAYRIPHVHIESVQVYTNTVPGGHMRAPGEPQALFALESQMDTVARHIGMDPLEFRTKNLIDAGEEMPTGTVYDEVKAKETLLAAIETSEYHSDKPPQVGRGIAMGERGAGGGESHAAVTLNPDGSIILNTAIFEQGTGTHTTLRQMVAEELGIAPERIEVEVWNTDAVPFDTGSGGSRVTRVASIAAHEAGVEARKGVELLTAELLGWPEERITLNGEFVTNSDTGESQPWTAILTRAGRSVTGRGASSDRERSAVTSFTAQVAEVSVDIETGEVKLLKLTTAHDVGTILNPVSHQGQINGGVMQGIGYAMMEELTVEDGSVTSLSFGDYKIPTSQDIPELRTVLVESDAGTGPYRTKSIGENPIGPPAAAIANAVEDAVGVRITDLPITSEKVYRALKAQ